MFSSPLPLGEGGGRGLSFFECEVMEMVSHSAGQDEKKFSFFAKKVAVFRYFFAVFARF